MKGSRARTRLAPARRRDQTGLWFDMTIYDRSGRPLFTADVSDAPADYGFEDCLGLCLSRACARAVSLANANLSGARIQDLEAFDIDLSGADLTDAWLPNCELIGCNLERATLRGTNLGNGDIKGCSFRQSNLLACDLTDATFQFCNFTEACFWSSRLGGATFWLGDFSGADLLGIDPSGIQCSDCRFDNTRINGLFA